ncbi:uncharacterized protein LOC119655077 isoform X2 [Hermetia illucens]|uniref:uncharacterized protein LOC119655077 isoform X2 n=1 Tax=Hermetia illucens TaxID=343691 RepID=UPI0018CC5591|nr:uncharacterized protein LOC119655077 isoform X2 [Hermetia illucens]
MSQSGISWKKEDFKIPGMNDIYSEKPRECIEHFKTPGVDAIYPAKLKGHGNPLREIICLALSESLFLINETIKPLRLSSMDAMKEFFSAKSLYEYQS